MWKYSSLLGPHALSNSKKGFLVEVDGYVLRVQVVVLGPWWRRHQLPPKQTFLLFDKECGLIEYLDTEDGVSKRLRNVSNYLTINTA
jgi:hypothetical protein